MRADTKGGRASSQLATPVAVTMGPADAQQEVNAWVQVQLSLHDGGTAGDSSAYDPERRSLRSTRAPHGGSPELKSRTGRVGTFDEAPDEGAAKQPWRHHQIMWLSVSHFSAVNHSKKAALKMRLLVAVLSLAAAAASNLPINIQQRDNVALAQTASTSWKDLGSMRQRFRVRENTSVIVYADVSSIGPKVMLRLLIDEESVSTVTVGQKKPSEGRYQSVSFHGASENLAAGSHEARVQYLSLCDTFEWTHDSNEDCFKDEYELWKDGEDGPPVPTDFPVPSHANAGETRLIVREVAASRLTSQMAPGYDDHAQMKTIKCTGTRGVSDCGEWLNGDGTPSALYGENNNADDVVCHCDFEDLFGTSVDFYPPAGTSTAVITVDLGWVLMCAALPPA